MSDAKLNKLTDELKKHKRVLVAFSGGLDSGFLLWAAVNALGSDNVMAVIGDSPSYATGEKTGAIDFARNIGLDSDRIKVIETKEMERPGYVNNSFDRCFHCKSELYGRLTEIARQNKFDLVIDGFNRSDEGDYRPGHQAACDLGVVSPLADAGLEKQEIIALAKQENLSLADKPASACLSSRIPFGTPITVEKLSQVDRAEYSLQRLGLKGFRVRHHGEVARLELHPDDINRVASDGLRKEVIAKIKEAGFKFVTLDLEGYQQGSFNPDESSNIEGGNNE